jgi:hypothetical protein
MAAALVAGAAPSLLGRGEVRGPLAVGLLALLAAITLVRVRRRGGTALWPCAPLVLLAVPGVVDHPARTAAVALAGLALTAVAERRAVLRTLDLGIAGAAAGISHWVVPHAPLVLFLAAALTFATQLNRRPQGDTFPNVYTAVAIVHDGTVKLDGVVHVIEAKAGENPYQLETGTDGHTYSHFPLAPSLLALPAAGLLAAAWVEPEDFTAYMAAGAVTAALVSAAAVALLYVLLTRLTSRVRAAMLAILFGWGTMVWPVAGQSLWQHGPALLALVGALLAIVDRRYAAAGFALAAMVAFRPSLAVAAAGVALLVPLAASGRLRACAWLLAGAAPVVIAAVTTNRATFGCFSCTGYDAGFRSGDGFTGSFLEGFSGNLLSPGRGLFVYTPVLLVALAGAWLGRRQPLYACAALAVAAHVVLTSFWYEWWGGEAFGPRQLLDVLPLLVVLLVPAVERWGSAPPFRRLFAVLAAWSLAVHFLGAALWPGTGWYDTHAVREFGTWWHPIDTELTAFFLDLPRLAGRGSLQLLLVAVSGVLAVLVARRVPSLALRSTVADRRRRLTASAYVSLVPFAVAAVSAPWLLEADLEGGDPFGGVALALVAGAFVLAVGRGAPTAAGLPAVLLALPAATGDPAWALVPALASLAVAAAERWPRAVRGARIARAAPAAGPGSGEGP